MEGTTYFYERNIFLLRLKTNNHSVKRQDKFLGNHGPRIRRLRIDLAVLVIDPMLFTFLCRGESILDIFK